MLKIIRIERDIMKKEKITLIVIVILGILATFAILYFGFYSSQGRILPDSDANLLSAYSPSIDIDSLFMGNNEVTQVATRYSILYKNDNYRKMYVSSIPIRNCIDGNQYSLVNRDVVQNENNKYITRNVDYNIDYLPDSVIIGNSDKWFKINILGDPSLSYVNSYTNAYQTDNIGVCYSWSNGYKIYISPSYNGMTISCEIDPDQSLVLPVEFSNMKKINKSAGYVVLKDKNADGDMAGNYFVISRPIVHDETGNVFISNPITIIEDESGSNLIYEKPYAATGKLSLTFSINYYCENMFFDCAAYENEPDLNYIFDSYVTFDSISPDSATYNYMKFNIKSFTPKKSKLLDKLTLNLYVIYCSDEVEIEVYSVRHDWCSWLLNWKKRPNNNEKIGEFKVSASGWYSIDLTQYAKLLIDEKYYKLENNTIMFKIKDGSAGSAVISSTDNSVMPPFFEVNYRPK